MSEIQIYIVLLISCLLGVESHPNNHASFRIIGGKAVNITDNPFMARFCSEYFCCGAAIVHERFLITSADCYYEFNRQSPNALDVIIGTDKTSYEGEVYDVAEGYIHPGYIPRENDYNIAVLKLTETLKFNERAESIQLAEKEFEIPEEAKFDSLGFGSTSTNIFDWRFPHQLQKVSIPYVPYEKCKRNILGLTERMICAGAEFKGSCIFDDGGPLVLENKLVGVLIIPGCGEKYYPSVFAYIPPLRDFIDAVIENNS